MSSIYQTPAIPSCPVPGNTLTWQCHPAEHTLPAGQNCLFAFAQSLTLCCGDGEVTTAPDLTSHPSFCLMPGCCGCDEKHICSHFKKMSMHTGILAREFTYSCVQTVALMLPLSFKLVNVDAVFCCVLVFVMKTSKRHTFAYPDI